MPVTWDGTTFTFLRYDEPMESLRGLASFALQSDVAEHRAPPAQAEGEESPAAEQEADSAEPYALSRGSTVTSLGIGAAPLLGQKRLTVTSLVSATASAVSPSFPLVDCATQCEDAQDLQGQS